MSPIEPQTVLVIGGANIDVSAVASSGIVAGQSTPGKILRSFGGVGRNIAETLTRLGIATRLVTATADDAPGRAVLANLNECGVDCRYSICVDQGGSSSPGTSEFVSIVSSSGEDVAQVCDMALLESCSVQQFAHVPDLIAHSDVVVIDANLPAAVLRFLIESSREATIIADAVSPAKSVRLKPWLSALTLLKTNEAEAAALTATALNTKGYSAELLDRMSASGPAGILLSQGASGATLSEAGERVHAPSQLNPSRTVNNNGTGDALLAGVIAARIHGYDLITQLQLGQQLAALTSLGHDAVNPTITPELLIGI